MNITIQSLGFTAGKALEDYVREKLAKIEHHSANIVSCDVILFAGPESDPDNCHCEIKLEMRGNDPFVEKKAKSYEEAIVDAVATLDKVLQKNKDKHITSRHAQQ